VKPPPKSRYQELHTKPALQDESEAEIDTEEGEDEKDDDDSSVADAEELDDAEIGEESAEGSNESTEDESESDQETVLAKVQESLVNGEQEKSSKKRKRSGKEEEEVEDAYMRKLAREEVKEEEERKKKQKTETAGSDEEAASEVDDSDEESYTIPKHETQLETDDAQEQELEKAARTVFLGNVSSEAITSKSAKKTLLRHLASFIGDLADNTPPHKVESLRFRSTAFTSALPKRAAFAKKEVLDATTKSTNAYAVYSTQTAAREASKRLNGTVVLNRHLRVDWLAHPAKTDHRRCVFVGNLGFVDDESTLKTDDDDKKKKNKPPGDVEEGLWVHFSKAGKIESVRVVRDPKTRVGKGIAYVQFENENGVEAALQFNEQKFPPLLPRKLRVVRAKAPKRKEKKPVPAMQGPRSKGVYNAKVTEEQKTTQGRARAMLGKAGAFKTAESFVFEGHRASSKQGNNGLKLGGKKKGKPSSRSTKRAAAWKSAGGKSQFKK
jgi:nucleolar protein 12